MTLPQLMFRIWDGVGHGDREEFFTFTDMNRCEYNANILATEAGVSTVTFIETVHASQFRYDEAQKLEDLTKAIADAIGVSVTIETAWSAGRRISYVDFERWESNLYACYVAMGGIGDRIESHQFLVTAHATLFASGWQGSGPFYYDLTMPAVHPTRDAIAYVDHNATVEQRVAEVNAILRPVVISDRTVRIYALSLRPKVNIPIKVTVGMMKMSETISLNTSWSGSGPWTKEVTLSEPESIADAVVGTCDSTTNAMAEEITKCGICVSGISGTTLTLTALFSKPSIALTMGVIYNENEVVD